MGFLSPMLHRSSVLGWMVLLGISAIAVAPSHRALGAKAPPSPFAGHYGCLADEPYFDVKISNTGRIRGTLDFWTDITGRISNIGYMQVTVEVTMIDWLTRDTFTITMFAVGLGARDEFGSLYGELEWDTGAVTEFYWPRCQ